MPSAKRIKPHLKSWRNYKNSLDKIIDLTNIPKPPSIKIISKPLVRSTAVDIAVDIIIKHVTYFLNPQSSISQDTTITKHGTAIRITRDSLEHIINHRKIGSYYNTKSDPSKWLNHKFQWTEFLCDEIIKPLLAKKAKTIKKSSLKKLLLDLLDCKSDIKSATQDLYNILNKISVTKYFQTFEQNILNPSFHHVHEKHKHFSSQADLILDDKLIDIKNSGKLSLTKDTKRQLLFYFFWSIFPINEYCCKERIHSCEANKINQLGIYYSRFDYLHLFKVKTLWKDNRRGFKKAKDIFRKAIS